MKRLTLVTIIGAILLGSAMAWPRLFSIPWQGELPLKITREEHGVRMERFSLRDTQQQQTRWEIMADMAQLDQQTDTTTIEGVHLKLFSAKHGTILVTAHRGTIHNPSKNMQVCGDVRLIVGHEFSLSTECLQWHAAEQALTADTPVSVDMGNLRVAGQGFRGWLAEERFEVSEQVTAHWSEP
jgi:LPS export ABC transporter protein LptC